MKDSFISNYMKEAIALAKKGAGFVNPNPLVGAVLVKNNKIIGRGYHKKYGDFHAERNAIFDAIKHKHDVKNSSLFVTLEPCCHTGKQPPCTDLIIQAGIKEVYIGSYDPNPLVNKKGIEILKKNNIRVFENILKEECDALNPYFFYYIKNKIPYVILKYAMSSNGISKVNSKDKIISCDTSIKDVHKTRAGVMAVMVSSTTVNTDNCLLTSRNNNHAHQPMRIILDRKLKIKLKSKILSTEDISPVIIFHHSKKIFKKILLAKKNIKLIYSPLKNKKLDLRKIFETLGNLNCDSILVESSGKLAESIIKENLANKIQIYMADNFIIQNKRYYLCSKKSVKESGKDLLIEFNYN
ncbi:bifunctional diaminohydroxyphosphoribosylaminopyrimidine deaminase/5-amino-6-(5-phosphoribosylamino)uracil reductase RibD [Treponema sp.]|uniref:bifunctional diaminohydroxyphosphoribosylaminopyrimidine deaminase/5-amino-6-(5-phosphoribosylamino)uracil reductase RibD n=1 Tax=Treponema sp. TaxID=166 RepID=UPI00298E6AD9|nr:bifunctional diaminohydroxyphosphoribosylaminopyrimidine deaminase/5-amino-6-(5-phosphoribosylamino)uracil reductase RibD [Treponema sp.]MCR5613934.1 bifunctional diaminohydroxyphosphoribosylaminopyrimidine deaminase/5-amino-6-(5-phosphoribosylamino)uracil reductase RibD [Treponema sp.]